MENEKLLKIIKSCADDTPRAEWVLRARQLLLSRMRHGRAAYGLFSTGARILAAVRFLKLSPAGLAPLGFAVVLGATLFLASRSLPGNVLYAVKLAAERVEGVLAQTPDSEAEYSLALAEKRLAELRELAHREQTDEPGRSALIAATVSRYAEALAQTKKTVSRLGSRGNRDPQLRAAVKIEKVAREYRVLLDSIDLHDETGVFENAKVTTNEAELAAEEIIAGHAKTAETPSSATPEAETASSVAPSASPSPEPIPETPQSSRPESPEDKPE